MIKRDFKNYISEFGTLLFIFSVSYILFRGILVELNLYNEFISSLLLIIGIGISVALRNHYYQPH